MEKIKNNLLDEITDEINFYLSISFVDGKFKVKGKKNESLKSIIDTFIQTEGFTKEFKNMSTTALCEANCVKIEKTLEENNIKEGSCVIIVLTDYEETPQEDSKFKDEKENFQEKEIEKEDDNEKDEFLDFESLLNDFNEINNIRNSQQMLYESIRLNNHCLNNKNGKDNEINPQFTSKKHNHGLVYLFSNNGWTCNLCNKSKSENIPKYYCSFCDYNLCDICIGDEKKYALKEYCHEQTKLKSFKFPFHNHKLIYCRTSRYKDKLTQWTCDICDITYSDKIWSFYCTFCDYDLCLNCSKKYYSNDELVNNIGIKTDEHEHILVYMITNKNWSCNLCSKQNESSIATYSCTKCEYNMCENCMRIRSDEQKYPFFSDGERLDYDIKKVEMKIHNHPLVYCITSRNRIPTCWFCDSCSKNYGIQDWSFFCSVCNYDICIQCYINSIEQ